MSQLRKKFAAAPLTRLPPEAPSARSPALSPGSAPDAIPPGLPPPLAFSNSPDALKRPSEPQQRANAPPRLSVQIPRQRACGRTLNSPFSNSAPRSNAPQSPNSARTLRPVSLSKCVADAPAAARSTLYSPIPRPASTLPGRASVPPCPGRRRNRRRAARARNKKTEPSEGDDPVEFQALTPSVRRATGRVEASIRSGGRYRCRRRDSDRP